VSAPDGRPVDAGVVAGTEFDSRREPMATVCQQVRLVADLTMNVPRDAAGDLECGAESLLTGIDAVDAVDAVDVTNLQPRLNDLQIEATVTVAVDVAESAEARHGDTDATEPGVEAASAVLAEGFGVTAVDAAQLAHSTAGADTPVQEYG
jgi:hypothetical protein